MLSLYVLPNLVRCDCNFYREVGYTLLELIQTLANVYMLANLSPVPFRTNHSSVQAPVRVGYEWWALLPLALSYLTLLDDDRNIHSEDDDHISLPNTISNYTTLCQSHLFE